MSEGQLGVIHPKGDMGPSIDVPILNNRDSIDLSYEQAIGYLKAKEIAFYHSFFPNVYTLEAFLAEIRKLFQTNENDRQILERLSNQNLKRLLPDYEPPVFERGYKLIINGDSTLIDFSVLNNDIIKVKDGKKYISIIPENAQYIKQLLNLGLQRQNNFNAFENNNKITKNLNKILDLPREQNSKLIGTVFTVQVDNKSVNKSIKDFDVIRFAARKGKDPWTKKVIAELAQNPTSPEAVQAQKELTASINYIKSFLFKDYDKASLKMKAAMNNAWSGTMGGTDVFAKDFFFEGKNYTKTILGQMGEFAHQILVEYLRLNATDTTLPPKIIKIIGSDFENGQQYHSDLEILLACGASVNHQTKNIGDDKKIPVNTNAALVEPLFGQEVISPLVNYFSAKDYAAQHGGLLKTFIDVFEENFYAAMNLNINDNLDVRQMNTFYFIGGTHLVPASNILETLQGRKRKGSGPKFNISGAGVPSYTEDEYEKKYKKHYIWIYEDGKINGDEMVASSYNAPLYQKNAVSISIQTSFSIPALLKSGNFRIF